MPKTLSSSRPNETSFFFISGEGWEFSSRDEDAAQRRRILYKWGVVKSLGLDPRRGSKDLGRHPMGDHHRDEMNVEFLIADVHLVKYLGFPRRKGHPINLLPEKSTQDKGKAKVREEYFPKVGTKIREPRAPTLIMICTASEDMAPITTKKKM